MVVMGFITVFEWDALFPDRRDYQVLTPQPLRLSTIFFTKTAALALFLGMFLVDINFWGVFFWPGVDGGTGLVSILASHLLSVSAAGLFSALALGAVQGTLVTLLRGNLYRLASVFLQTLLMAVLVMLLFLSPLAAGRLRWLAVNHPNYLYYFPGFWFIGFYETLRPATHSPVLHDLGVLAWRGLGCAAGLFLLTYLPGYRGHSRRVLEAPAPRSTGPGLIRRGLGAFLQRTLLRHPVEWAVFRFINQTITRSMKHRLFLATYGGFGAAMAVLTLASGRSGWLELPHMLVFVLVSGLRAAFNFPSELAANWSFQVTETAGIHPYLSATRKWIVTCAILPLFLLLSPLEFVAYGWPVGAFHLAYGIALSLVLTEILFFGFHKAPFTCAHFPGKVNLVFLGVMYVFGFTTYSGTMTRLERWLEWRPVMALLFLAAAGGACVMLWRYGQRSLGPKASLAYDDPADPVVRTLGIAVR
jgi:hypothetical protein